VYGILGDLTILFRLEIKAVHFNLSPLVQHLQSWCDHVDLLVNFYLLGCSIIIITIFVGFYGVLDSYHILHFFSHFQHFWVRNVNGAFLYGHKVLDELLFSITLYIFDTTNLNGKQV